MAPQEPQAYHLKRLTEIEVNLLDEIEFRELLAKKMKRFTTITSILDTDLIKSAVITGGVSIVAFASGVSLPVDIALTFFCQLFFLANSHYTKIF